MKKSRNEVAVGAFVIIGFTMLSLMVFFVSGVYLFRSGYTVNVLYDYVDILDKGAPVRMAGVRVGEVSGVELFFDEASKHSRVKVKLFIENNADIRENYAFEIRGTHILSEPHIEITPRPGDKGPLKDGAVLEGEHLAPLEDLIKRSQRIAKDLEEIVGSIHAALGDEQSGESLKKLMFNLSELSESMKTIMGGSEADLKQTMVNINASSESIRNILDDMEKGQGTVGGLLVKDELYQDMREFMADLKKHPWKLLKKDGGDKKFLVF